MRSCHWKRNRTQIDLNTFGKSDCFAATIAKRTFLFILICLFSSVLFESQLSHSENSEFRFLFLFSFCFVRLMRTTCRRNEENGEKNIEEKNELRNTRWTVCSDAGSLEFIRFHWKSMRNERPNRHTNDRWLTPQIYFTDLFHKTIARRRRQHSKQ